MSSPGLEHCKITIAGKKHHAACNHCDWSAVYNNPVVAQRMASNHIVKRHPDIAKPSNQVVVKKRAHTKRATAGKSPLASVNFCPGCGCNLLAVKAAMTL